MMNRIGPDSNSPMVSSAVIRSLLARDQPEAAIEYYESIATPYSADDIAAHLAKLYLNAARAFV